MRLLFICGSFEQEKDGVADYIVRLIGGLRNRGINCTVLGIADKYIDEPQNLCYFNGNNITDVYRFPYKSGLLLNVRLFISLIGKNKFDIISLQYVPYGFNKKGISIQLLYALNILKPYASSFHIMFHEIWLLDTRKFKNKIVSILQKVIIQLTPLLLKSFSIHTSNQFYQYLLKEKGINCSILPLAPNLPVVGKIGNTKLDSDSLRFLFFGSIYPTFSVNDVLDIFENLSIKLNKKISFTVAGRIGVFGDKFIVETRKRDFGLEIISHVDPVNFYELVSKADFGVVSTTLPLVEKSGAYALFRDYGLPVVNLADPWRPRGYIDIKNKLLIEISDCCLFEFINTAKRVATQDRTNLIVDQFIKDNQIIL